MPVYSRNKVLILIFGYALLVIGILSPLILQIRKPQQPFSQSAPTAFVSFSTPNTQVEQNQTIPVSVLVDSKNYPVTYVTLDIQYDAAVLRPNENLVELNTSLFPYFVESPVFIPGRIRAKVATGSDFGESVTPMKTVLTIHFTVIAVETPFTSLTHGESTAIVSFQKQNSLLNNFILEKQPITFTILPPQSPAPTLQTTRTFITPLSEIERPPQTSPDPPNLTSQNSLSFSPSPNPPIASQHVFLGLIILLLSPFVIFLHHLLF